MLTLPVLDRVVPTPAKLSLGDRLLRLIGIGRAEANPAVIVAATAGLETAGVGVAQSPTKALDSLRSPFDNTAVEYNKAMARLTNLGETNTFTFSTPQSLVLESFVQYKKNKQRDKPRAHAPDRDKKYLPAPKELPGFPEAKKAKSKTYDSDGKLRKRWKLPDSKILEWDKQHGELEHYTSTGKDHLGGFDPKTGEQRSDPKPGRRVEP